MKISQRTQILFGKSNIKKLASKNVLIVGVGGVGGYVAEMLARTSVGKITLMDFDVVNESNINRQIIALKSTIGKYKVDVMKQRIEDINPKCKVTIINEKLEKDKLDEYDLTKYDFIVDAIDDTKNKVELIYYAKQHNIRIISALGAGNRKEIPNFEVCDIYDTYNDGLAKVIRKQLREKNISKHTVVSTKQKAEHTGEKEIGSVAYQPAMCGCVLAGYVICELIKED